MKKTLILTIVAIAAMGCAKKYNAQNVTLLNQNDSVNYALGLVSGQGIKMDAFASDSSDAPIIAFMASFEEAYSLKQELNEPKTYGKNLGTSIKEYEKTGLGNNPAWALNEQILLQALVNGIEGDTVMLQPDNAYAILSAAYQASASAPEATEKVVKIKKAPKKALVFDLKSKTDTLNYAMGVLQGARVKMLMAQDSTGEDLKDFMKGINEALKLNSAYPMLTMAGEQVGNSIRNWEESGLFGEPSLAVDIELIKQGFINGMRLYGEWDIQEANQYISEVLNDIRYGSAKLEGEEFLEANKAKEGIKVTESGLQYEVIKMGKGKKPAATDRVKVHYHGTLIDGTVFDSSVERKEPATFGLNQVIAGWTEGLQLMPVGSKFKFYIPQELGYGSRPAGSIPPYSVLIFEVELLSIEK